MRCLALAQAWQKRGGDITFVVCMIAPALGARLISEGIKIVHLDVQPGSINDAIETTNLARDVEASWIVVDGYHFGSEYQRFIKNSGQHLLFIDDNGHADYYYADIVLNQNLHANEGLYCNKEPYTRFLLGAHYALLRKEFWPWKGWKRTIPDTARKVLVTLGGSDPDNVTQKVTNALCQLDGLEAIITVGASNHDYEKLKTFVESLQMPFRIETNVIDMPKLMAWADVAVSSGGTTSWELAFMGLPSIIIILAENQVNTAERLENAGAASNIGWHNRLDCQMIQQEVASLLAKPEVRASMASRGNLLVDGSGAERVIAAMQDMNIHLRRALESDCELIYRWVNDPGSMAASFSTRLVPWEEHSAWFRKKIQDKHCIFFIALNELGRPLGQVRFDLSGEDAVISISIDCNARGHGLGSLIIIRAIDEVFSGRSISQINAFIKPYNIRSIKAFEKAGFHKVGQEIIKGNKALRYVRIRKRYLKDNFEHADLAKINEGISE